MDDYAFRRELDLSTDLPEMIVQLKKDRHFRKMDLARNKELYDEFYAIAKEYFLLGHVSAEEHRDIQNAATLQMLERARQERIKPLQ